MSDNNNNNQNAMCETIDQAQDGKMPAGDPLPEDNSNLMVNFMPPDMNEKELFKMFVRFGPIETARVIREPVTKTSRCFGFVQFKKADNAMLAQVSLNGRELRGKRLKVAFAKPSPDLNKHTVVYVGNLPKQYATEQKILELFKGFGCIQDINIPTDQYTGCPHGLAFVRFRIRTAAEVAVLAMNGRKLENDWYPLQVRFARIQKDNSVRSDDQQVQESQPDCSSTATPTDE